MSVATFCSGSFSGETGTAVVLCMLVASTASCECSAVCRHTKSHVLNAGVYQLHTPFLQMVYIRPSCWLHRRAAKTGVKEAVCAPTAAARSSAEPEQATK